MLFVICSFCGGEFKSLGRHAWRCKEKLKSDGNGEPTIKRKDGPIRPSIATTCEISIEVTKA